MNWQDSPIPHNLLTYNSIQPSVPGFGLARNIVQHLTCGGKRKKTFKANVNLLVNSTYTKHVPSLELLVNSTHHLHLQNVFEAYKLGRKNSKIVKSFLVTTFFE